MAIFRAFGAAFDLARYLRKSGLKPDASWRAGEPRSRGRAHVDTGFSVSVADEDSREALVAAIMQWLQANQPAIAALSGAGATAELDVGIGVGSSKQFTASVTLAPSALALLAELGVSYRVSAYPLSDGDDDDDV